MTNFKGWAKAAGIRAVKTFAQSFISMITIGQAFVDVDWLYVLSVSGVAAVISLVTSLAGLPEVENTPAEEPKGEGDDHEGN